MALALPETLTELEVSIPYEQNCLDLSWTDPNQVCNRVTGYHVYRSSTGSMFIRLTDTPLAVRFYRDSEAPVRLDKQYWYQVTAVNATGESVPTDPVTLQNADYGQLTQFIPEFIRREGIMLSIGGEPAKIWVRRKIGKVCSCYDPGTYQGKARCPICFGQWIEGGYDRFSVTIQHIPATQRVVLANQGLAWDNRPRMWMSTFPRISSDDIVLRVSTGERFWFKDRKPIEARGILTRQEAALEFIPTKEIYYTLT